MHDERDGNVDDDGRKEEDVRKEGDGDGEGRCRKVLWKIILIDQMLFLLIQHFIYQTQAEML